MTYTIYSCVEFRHLFISYLIRVSICDFLTKLILYLPLKVSCPSGNDLWFCIKWRMSCFDLDELSKLNYYYINITEIYKD